MSPIVPLEDVKVPVQPMEYSPPAMPIGIAVLMPPTEMALEVRTELRGTLAWIWKGPNAAGCVSQASVATLNERGVPAMVTVTVVVVLQLDDAVWRSVSCWPGLMVPAAAVKLPWSMRYSPP